MIEKLKELAGKKSFTADDKAWIVEKSKELGLEFNPKKGCSNCYLDQVLKLYNEVKLTDLVIIEEQASESDYILKPHIDTVINGVRYNNATLTANKAKYLLSLGFEKWFLKIKDESN